MLRLDVCFDEFVDYLKSEKDSSPATITSYSGDFKIFHDFVVSNGIPQHVDEITTPHLRKYLTSLKEKGYSLESLRRKIHSLRSFYKFLESQDYITKNPASRISAPKSIEKIPPHMQPEEIKKLIQVAMKYGCENALRDKCILEMYAFSGMRRTELLTLDWIDIDFGAQTVTVRKGKGKKQRIIPFTEPLVSDMWAYLQTRLPLSEQAVFISCNGTRLSISQTTRMFRKYLHKAGLSEKGYTIHSLRHSYATLLLQSGVDLISIQKLMGHADLNSTRIYTKAEMSHLQKQVRKFPLANE